MTTITTHGTTQLQARACKGDRYRCIDIIGTSGRGEHVTVAQFFFADPEDWERAKKMFDGLDTNRVDEGEEVTV